MPNTRPSELLARAITPHRDDGKSGLNPTFIIVVVAAGVGGLVLLVLAYTCIRRAARRSSNRTPLPPIQPLAHVRERLHSQYFSDSRPSTWYNGGVQHRPTYGAPGSEVSLIQHNPSREYLTAAPSASRQNSGDDGTLTTPTTESHAMEELPVPQRRFSESPMGSSSSVNSGDSRGVSPASETPSASGSGTPLIPRSRKTSAVSRRSIHSSRPMSLASSMRGTPHGPHSNVQIVLPTPLAPELNPYYSARNESGEDMTMNRRSVVDAWASVAVTANDAPEVPKERRRRTTSQPDLHRSESSSTVSSAHSRRSRERTRSGGVLSKSGPSANSLHPPVPQIPAHYATSSGSTPSPSGSQENVPTVASRPP